MRSSERNSRIFGRLRPMSLAIMSALALFGTAAFGQARVTSVDFSPVTDAKYQREVVEKRLTPIAKGLVGEDFTDEGMAEAAAKMTEASRSAGWVISRIVVTPADQAEAKKSGVLRFTVIEGAVGKITLNNTSKVKTRRLAKTMGTALCGKFDVQGDTVECQGDKALTNARLERAELLLGDIPGVDVGVPGLSADGVGIGQTHLTEGVAPLGRRLLFSVGMDNYGSSSVGRARFVGTVSGVNLLGEGDVLKVLATATNKNYYGGDINFSLPIGYSGLRWYVDASSNYFTINNADLTGRSTGLASGFSYPIFRAFGYDLRANLDVSKSWGRSSFGDATLSESTSNAVDAGLTWDDGDRRRLAGESFTAANLTVTNGNLIIGSAEQAAQDAASANTQGKFTKAAYTILRKQNIGSGTNAPYLVANLHGQFASKNLDAGAQMVTGGVTGARAYSSDEPMADTGHILQLDLRKPFTVKNTLVTGGVFMDAAHVQISKDPWVGAAGNTRNLLDAGISLDANVAKRASVGLMWAHRLGGERSIANPGSSSQLWLTFSGQF